MAAVQIFKVVTEFQFEIGAAVLGTRTLTKAVDGLSQSADDALFTFKRLGIGIVAQFAGAGGGLLGVFATAVRSSEKFKQSLIGFSSIIQLNRDKLIGPIDTFAERLRVSQAIMEDINQTAQNFSLPAGQLLQFTKLLAPILTQKGAAGKNFRNAIDISRGVLKAAPTLGLAPGLIENQLLRIIEGRAGGENTLFRRLAADTSTFQGLGGGGKRGGAASAFNALPVAKRVDILTRALAEFSEQADEVRANAEGLTGQMQQLKDAILGPFSVLKPLGDVIIPPIVAALSKFNKVLRNEGAEIIQNLAKLAGPLVADPRKLIINLLQLKELSGDLSKTGTVATFAGILLFLPAFVLFIARFGIAGKFIGALLTPLALVGTGIHLLTVRMFSLAAASLAAARAVGGAGIVAGVAAVGVRIGAGLLALPLVGPLIRFAGKLLGPLFRLGSGFVGFVSRVFVPLAAVLAVFQTFSRAIGIATVKNAERLPAFLARFSAQSVRLSKAVQAIFLPLNLVINQMAEWISELFTIDGVLANFVEGSFGNFVDAIAFAGEKMILATAAFQGFAFAALQLFDNLSEGKIFGITDDVARAFNAGIDDVIMKNQNLLRGLSDETPIVSQVNNFNGGIKIENQFKENLQPDRIAFTLKEQLLKIARNPTQATGRTIQGGSFRGRGASGSF